LVPIESLYETSYLVINTNLYLISHCFRVVADYWSNFYFRQGYTLVPLKLRTTKFFIKKLETSLYRTELLLTYLQTIISFCHSPRVWQTDRQTDRQTNWRTDRKAK